MSDSFEDLEAEALGWNEQEERQLRARLTKAELKASQDRVRVEWETLKRLTAERDRLRGALEDMLPLLEHLIKFLKYQKPGKEFWPNREEGEAVINEARETLAFAREAMAGEVE